MVHDTRMGHTVSASQVRSSTLRTSILPSIFLLTLIIPVMVDVFGLRLSAYRITLLLLFLFVMIRWATSKSIKSVLSDWAVLAMCLWVVLSFLFHYGFKAVEPIGIFLVETLGAYFLARAFVRNYEGMRRMTKAYLTIVLLLLPFALVETTTGNNVLMNAFRSVGQVLDDVPKEPRWGFDRVQGPFDHPILFGVFCAGAFPLVYYVLGLGRCSLKNIVLSFSTWFTAALSLSSGPLTAMVAQLGLIGWDVMFKRYKKRWRILIALTVFFYAVIEIGSNRSVPEVFISYFAFSTETAYNRLLIWEFGSQSVLNNPLFGVGLGEWERPVWMGASMDMFWLVMPVRHGIVAGFCLFVAVLGMLWLVIKRKTTDQKIINCRTGFCIVIVAYILTGWTVHFWNATYVLFMFLLGAGGWLAEREQQKDGQDNVLGTIVY